MAFAWAMPRLRRTRCRLARMLLVIVMPQHSLLPTHRKRVSARQFAIHRLSCSGCTDSSRRADSCFLAARERELNGQTRKGRNDMRTTWCVILIAASAMIGTIDVLHAQPEENPGRNEFLRSCASCHGVSGKGDGPVAKSLSPPPSDLTRLSEANNGVFPVSRVHEVIDGRIESLVHGRGICPCGVIVICRK